MTHAASAVPLVLRCPICSLSPSSCHCALRTFGNTSFGPLGTLFPFHCDSRAPLRSIGCSYASRPRLLPHQCSTSHPSFFPLVHFVPARSRPPFLRSSSASQSAAPSAPTQLTRSSQLPSWTLPSAAYPDPRVLPTPVILPHTQSVEVIPLRPLATTACAFRWDRPCTRALPSRSRLPHVDDEDERPTPECTSNREDVAGNGSGSASTAAVADSMR
ncbi:hypothetical protein FB45DRAFT_936450 [Roridomyces roridus]|uniref:Uncharacterized protein n=1 Tax=Roridomyces roridus TaxID=1738132 RepID=A0AAD7FE71_9AGAR|nr:hypothetical protein FB45DRAFT_936450 [Roridomyces roridus]